jgi:hypothetical protein
MRAYRNLSLCLAGALVLAFTAALARPSNSPPPPRPEVALPEATSCLDEAIGRLTRGKIDWLQCTIRQQVTLPGLHYTAEGRYLLAPDHRFRLEVQTRTGDKAGTLLNVSDGATLWQASCLGQGPWDKVTRIGVREVLAAIDGAGNAARLRTDFLEGPMFSGIAPLLRALRGRLVWVGRTANRDHGNDMIQLTGVWPPDALREKAPADHPWPNGLPQHCRIVLEARTLWPRRIEWWGPLGPQGADQLLALTEYSAPVLNEPLADDVCARAFAFAPGSTPVTDRTSDVAADLAARIHN